jgi:2-dehydropantoate 2-reductase
MSDHKPLSVLAFGAGAIGTYIGGSLALAGNRLVFVEQPAVAAELRQRGLRLDLTIDKRRKLDAVSAVPPDAFLAAASLAEALEHGPFDVAIFALKSFDTAPALEGIKPFAQRMPPLLCLQNGVDNEPAIAAVLGADKVIAGTVTGSVGRNAAGDIVLEKARGVGVAAGHPLSERLVEALIGASLNARLFPRAADMKWSKMLANLPGAATSAIVDMTIAEVFSNPGLYALEMRLSREAQAVMAAQGIRVVNLPGMPVQALALASRLPAFIAQPLLKKVVGGGRGGKMPSYHIDLHAGRKTSEVEWLQGAVVRYGEKAGVPTPINRLLTQTLLAMVRGEIPIAEFSRQPEKLIAQAAQA